MRKIRIILLWPFSFIYGIVTALRNKFYDWKIFPSEGFDQVKTICVGNLSAGGTGKTPHIEYLIRLLKKDYRIATLSRGYKRKTTGFVLVNSDSTAQEIGDEPMQFKQKFPEITVAVDSNRARGIKKLLETENPPEIILLDDAMQHRSIKPGLTILLTEYHNLFFNDHMLPGGNLREYPSNFLRADIIIITKTPEYATNIDLRVVFKDLKPMAYQSIFFSYISYGNLYHILNPADIIKPAIHLFRCHVLLVTGIANPQPLNTYIREYANETTHIRFPDHHKFSNGDMEQIKNKFNAIEGKNKIIVTTEKDAMRLRDPELLNTIDNLPIYILPIEITLKSKNEELNEKILTYVRTRKFHHKKYS